MVDLSRDEGLGVGGCEGGFERWVGGGEGEMVGKKSGETGERERERGGER